MKSAILVMLAGCAVMAQPNPRSAALVSYDEAVANEKKLFAADQKHEMDTVASIVADEFVDIARDGSSIGKKALLDEIPKIKLIKYEQQNFRVVTMGPYSYSISYDSDATMIGADGKEAHSQNALNSVWIRRDGRWQMLLHSRGEAHPLSAR
jgi:hypothetical protein